MYRVLFLCLFLFGNYCIPVKSQTTVPAPPDFTDLTGSWVKATYGPSEDPFAHTGISPNRHVLIASPGTDSYTNGKLSLLPENTSGIIRLGEARSGQSESVSYRFIVDPEKPLLKVKLAAVINESISTPYADRFNFSIVVTDASGNLLHSCAKFDLDRKSHVYSTHLNFHSHNPKSSLYWLDWTELILDLSAGSGQEVEVRFVKNSGHQSIYNTWAYVYFTAICIPAKIEMYDCSGREFKLSAPGGYFDYTWSKGEQGQTVSGQTGDSDMRLSCSARTINGCATTHIASIHLHGNIPGSNRVICDTIQQGESYNQNSFYLGSFPKTGNYIYHQTFCEAGACRSETFYSLFLHVRQSYYPLEATICEGEDYTDNGFEWHAPPPGLYYDTLRLTSAKGQDSIVCLKLSVSVSHLSPERITGNTSPCCGTLETYTIPFASYDVGNFWQWEVPPGVSIYGTSRNRTLEAEFTDEARAGNITLHYSTGCTSGSVSLRVSPRPSYQQFQTDTICSGNEYHKNNFHLPRQTETGLHYQFHRTAAGCDSTLSLALTILPSPEIKMVRSDSVICEGEEIELYVQDMKQLPEEDPGPFVAVGDIYCTDGSILRPANYATSGKTAEGVVFWVDESGQHGWIVHKENQCEDCSFVTGEGIALPEGIGTDADDQIVTDTAGYHNTRIFWESGRINDFPAIRSIPFGQGWYLPASKQLLILAGNLFSVDGSLEMIGGKIFAPAENREYWSSTQYEKGNGVWTWCQVFNRDYVLTYMVYGILTQKSPVRSIRNF